MRFATREGMADIGRTSTRPRYRTAYYPDDD